MWEIKEENEESKDLMFFILLTRSFCRYSVLKPLILESEFEVWFELGWELEIYAFYSHRRKGNFSHRKLYFRRVIWYIKAISV